MNTFNKSFIISLASLLLGSSLAFSATNTKAENKEAPKFEKTSDAGTIIFRIENIQPIKDKQGDVKQCSYVITAYNRLNQMVKEANLDFVWQDNITGQYLKRIDESSKLSADEITENLSADAPVNAPTKSLKESPKFKPIVSSVKIFNIAPHSQKSFSNTVDTDKCFLLFDNLNYTVKDCTLDGEENVVKDNKVVQSGTGCVDKFNYINSKNPEYYAEFGDVPENIVQDQIEDQKNMEIEKINNNYKEVITTLDKVDNTLRNMR